MIKKIQKSIFFKNALLYTFGSMITPMIGLIMLPIYTNYLSTAEYGIMTTVQTLVGLLQILLLLSLNSAVTRFFYDFLNEPYKQKKYLGTIFSFVFMLATIIAIILLLFNNIIGNLIFNNIPVTPYYYYLVGISWCSALLTLPLALLRAQEKAGIYVIINTIKAFSIMLLTGYLIIWKGMGAESALISQLIITFIVMVLVFLTQLKYIKFSWDKEYMKNSLIFSLPLLPHVASAWIIKSSDRIILEKYITISELGIYSLAAQISLVLSIFYTSLNNALIPRYTRLRKEKKEIEARKLLKIFSVLVLSFGLISIPIAMYSIQLITSKEYYGAISLIPLLLVGEILKGFYFIPVAKLFYSKKTKAIATSSTIAALINILVNLSLIPYIGIYGAILSTVVAEIVRLFLIYRASKFIKK